MQNQKLCKMSVRLRASERGEGESVERKQLYLHEAYLDSGLQNNGRKRVHGTFPFRRACVPLSRVSWPRAALRSTETSLFVGSSGLFAHRLGKVGGYTSRYLMVESLTCTECRVVFSIQLISF